MLLFEGVLPFLLPKAWRETFTKMIALKDGQLRFVGLISMLFGLFLMYLGQ
jgi:uncharacterized protein YjeT (DUF2065 family)